MWILVCTRSTIDTITITRSTLNSSTQVGLGGTDVLRQRQRPSHRLRMRDILGVHRERIRSRIATHDTTVSIRRNRYSPLIQKGCIATAVTTADEEQGNANSQNRTCTRMASSLPSSRSFRLSSTSETASISSATKFRRLRHSHQTLTSDTRTRTTKPQPSRDRKIYPAHPPTQTSTVHTTHTITPHNTPATPTSTVTTAAHVHHHQSGMQSPH